MASLLDMLNRGGPGVPERASPLTAAVQQASAVQQTPLMRPTANRRSGPGLLDTIWGVAAGYSPGATRQMNEQREVAADRMRLQQAQQQELATIARSQGPQAYAAFLTNPQEFGKAAASHGEAYTLNRGATRYGPHGEVIAAPKVIEQFGDRFGIIDPLNPEAGATYTAPRGMTAAEELDSQKLAENQRQFGISSQIQQQNADTSRLGAVGNLEVAQGGLDIRQQELARTDAERGAAKTNQANAVVQTAENMGSALGSARRFLSAAGALNQYNPL